MRVAFVTEFYYPHFGGVSEHVHNLALRLNAAGHSAVVITSRMAGAERDEPFVRRIGRSRVIFSNGSFARVTTGRRLGRRIGEILRSEGADLVHLHGALTPTLGLLGQDAADRLGLPVVATFHSWFPRSRMMAMFRKALQARLDRIAAKIAVSRAAVEAHARYFRADWEVIPNGINVDYFHRDGRGPGDAFVRGPRLLFLGRLDPRNGLRTLFGALPEIAREIPGTRLLVAGDGPLGSLYRLTARRLGGRVEFLGRVFDDRPRIYASSDLYLCPTRRASFGITLLEAMACGTPPVVSDITGFRELVDHGTDGLLVPSRSPRAWSEAVCGLIRDPEARERMALAGLRKSAEFSWPRVADRVISIYDRVLRA